MEDEGKPAVLVVSPGVRSWLSKAVKHRVADLTVLAYSEIPDEQAVKVVHTVEASSRK
jgi:flagellar biosynthesis protein FlhA